MKQKAGMGARTLRGILGFLLVLVAVIGGGLFYLGTEQLRNYAVEVSHVVADGEASGKQIEGLQVLKGQLSQSQELVNKANLLFATPDSYQSQVVGDLQRYASASGVTITKTSFDVPEGEAIPTGGEAVTVVLASPASYLSVLKFLDGIEGNLPKLQVMNIGLGHLTNGASGDVSVDEIIITVATR